ncbi:MAG: DMT family transporter [Bacteroidetes bacterium]|nr:DMT family transporter [Bacteroidota bacterium]
MDFQHYSGELAALGAAVFWTITALSFEVASKKVGSLAVNMIRLVIAFVLLMVFCYFYRGMALPTDASAHAWIWLSLSGLIGFVFGDYFLFRAYAVISSRIAMLVMTLVPPITAITGWLMLGEVLSPLEVTGMVLTVSGIAMAVLNRKNDRRKLKLSYPLQGILFALAGTVGQAIGLVLSKYGMQQYDAFAATQIRVLTGMVGFAIIIAMLRRWNLVSTALKNKPGMTGIAIGSVFGPFLGVSFSLIAVKFASTGVASTIMATVPIMLIPPSVILFKQKLSPIEIIGAFISVGGVALLFLK